MYGLYSIFIPVYAFLFLPALSALRARIHGFGRRAASVQWSLMVSVYAISYAPALLQLPVAIEQGCGTAEGSAPGSGGTEAAALGSVEVAGAVHDHDR